MSRSNKTSGQSSIPSPHEPHQELGEVVASEQKFRRPLLKRLPSFFCIIFALVLTVGAFFVVTQDIQIFPGLIGSFFGSKVVAPKDVETISLSNQEHEDIVVWRVEGPSQKRKQVALLFHGNANTVANSVHVQRWFQSWGFTSYALEYPGYGASSGWPSEKGIYLDAETTIDWILQREQVTANDIVVFGNSIGVGPAAYIANKYKVSTLVIIAPYTSIADVVSEMPLFGYLTPFLWTTFPTKEFIGKLSNTCVVAAHGKHDTTIPYHHSLELRSLYRGMRSYVLLTSDVAGHNDIFASVHKEVAKAMESCLAAESGTEALH